MIFIRVMASVKSVTLTVRNVIHTVVDNVFHLTLMITVLKNVMIRVQMVNINISIVIEAIIHVLLVMDGNMDMDVKNVIKLNVSNVMKIPNQLY